MFVFLAVASFTAVLVQQNEWFSIDPGILVSYGLYHNALEVPCPHVICLKKGLAISMLVQLSGLFQWCIRQSAEVVNQFVAVERYGGVRLLLATKVSFTFAHKNCSSSLRSRLSSSQRDWLQRSTERSSSQ